MDVSNKVEIKAYIIANEDLNLASDNFHKDYHGHIFQIEKGDILGQAEGFSFVSEDDTESYKNLGSIFHVKKNSQGKLMDVGLDGTKYIIISLSEDDYQLYIRAARYKLYEPILISMFIVPALLFTINSMKEKGGDHEDKNWYRVILKRCSKLGFEEDPADWENPLEIIQKIIENQMSKSLSALKELRDEEEVA